jgi:hypothetical protein
MQICNYATDRKSKYAARAGFKCEYNKYRSTWSCKIQVLLLCQRPLWSIAITATFTSHFFFFLSLEGGAALVPRMASKVLLGSLLESGRSWGEFMVGGATPGGRGRASRPMFMTLCRLLSGTGLPDRDRIPAPLGSRRPGGAGSGEASALSSCIAAFRSVSLAAHCWAFLQQ